MGLQHWPYAYVSTFQSSPLLIINNIPIKRVAHTKSLGTKIRLGMFKSEYIVKTVIGAQQRCPYSTLLLTYNCLFQTLFRQLSCEILAAVFLRKNYKNYKIEPPECWRYLAMIQMRNIRLENWTVFEKQKSKADFFLFDLDLRGYVKCGNPVSSCN